MARTRLQLCYQKVLLSESSIKKTEQASLTAVRIMAQTFPTDSIRSINYKISRLVQYVNINSLLLIFLLNIVNIVQRILISLFIQFSTHVSMNEMLEFPIIRADAAS